MTPAAFKDVATLVTNIMDKAVDKYITKLITSTGTFHNVVFYLTIAILIISFGLILVPHVIFSEKKVRF